VSNNINKVYVMHLLRRPIMDGSQDLH